MGNLHLMTERSWQPEDHAVSKTMQQYFANFILTGNPNGQELPLWPAAEANDPTPPIMVIDVESRIMAAENDARYLFLDKIYGNE
jgi:para-nitrobenzyl esterase